MVRALDDSGEIKRGLREIASTEAAIVRRIFNEYLAGKSPRAIAAALNREGVPAPLGRQWNASTINGNAQRGNGILCNPLYGGQLVYNRIRMVKDPETGKRISRLNPPAEWITRHVPAFRIIEGDEWDAEQKRKRARLGEPWQQQKRPKHLFSGLVRCGLCGGAYVIRTRTSLGCSNHHESGTCRNGHRIPLAKLEQRVLHGIASKLLSPEAIHRAVAAYHAERNRLAVSAGDQRRALERRIAKLGREIERGVRAIFDGTASRAVHQGLAALEREKDGAESDLAALQATGDKIVVLHPGAIEAYSRAIEDLSATLRDEDGRAKAAQLIRGLVEKITVTPRLDATGKRDDFDILAYGRLAELLAPPSKNAAGTNRTVRMVAGERYQRYLPLFCARVPRAARR